MRDAKTRIKVCAAAILAASSIAVFGCSSSPDQAELKQLQDLKDEVASLDKEIAAKNQGKGSLDKEVAEKNAKLTKCHSDQEVVRQRLGK